MIAQLRAQQKSVKEANNIVDEIFPKQKFQFIENHTPQTVGEYYKKHLANGNSKTSKRKALVRNLRPSTPQTESYRFG